MEPRRKHLLRFVRVLAAIKDFDDRLSLGHVEMLITVALHEGKSNAELAKLSKTSLSTVSRYMLDLSEKLRTGEKGFGLAIRESDAVDLRKNNYRLSNTGRALVNQVELLLDAP